jgi:hypothetical protein
VCARLGLLRDEWCRWRRRVRGRVGGGRVPRVTAQNRGGVVDETRCDEDENERSREPMGGCVPPALWRVGAGDGGGSTHETVSRDSARGGETACVPFECGARPSWDALELSLVDGDDRSFLKRVFFFLSFTSPPFLPHTNAPQAPPSPTPPGRPRWSGTPTLSTCIARIWRG